MDGWVGGGRSVGRNVRWAAVLASRPLPRREQQRRWAGKSAGGEVPEETTAEVNELGAVLAKVQRVWHCLHGDTIASTPSAPRPRHQK